MSAVKNIILSTIPKVIFLCSFILELIFPKDFDYSLLEEKLSVENHESRYRKYFNHYYFLNYKEKLVKDAIWQLKFKNNRRVSKIFAQLFYDFLSGKVLNQLDTEADSDSFILIPIPIHKKRRVERGFNQCEWLCEDIMNKIEKTNRSDKDVGGSKIHYSPKILLREKYTEKQSWSSNRKERLEKLRGVFSIEEKYRKYLVGKKIILIDDVVTTGTTLNEARRTLLESGASLVISVVVAH